MIKVNSYRNMEWVNVETAISWSQLIEGFLYMPKTYLPNPRMTDKWGS